MSETCCAVRRSHHFSSVQCVSDADLNQSEAGKRRPSAPYRLQCPPQPPAVTGQNMGGFSCFSVQCLCGESHGVIQIQRVQPVGSRTGISE